MKPSRTLDLPNGDSPDQLGNTQGTTFWEASKQILMEVFNVLKPNGHAVWVVKDYVRDGQIVPFSQQWRAMCEHVGFVTLHEHHALLYEDHGTQGSFLRQEGPTRTANVPPEERDPLDYLIDESTYVVDTSFTAARTKKISFFRRLHEKRRPDLAIEFEVVLCMVKPGGEAPGEWDCCVASPPYANGLGKEDTYADQTKRANDSQRRIMREKGIVDPYYGTHPAQLGNLPQGSCDAVIASPPYSDSWHSADTTAITEDRMRQAGYSEEYIARSFRASKAAGGNLNAQAYGATQGQLGAMPPGEAP